MIDILIPLGLGSNWGNNELRYSLRSVEKHLSGVGNVFIIGEKPEWITNIIHIPHSDIPQGSMRDYNIFLKIMAGIRDERLSDRFLYMSDDHYLRHSFDASAFPYYSCGDILDRLKEEASDVPYIKVLQNTYNYLTAHSFETENFNVHAPVVYNKSLFEDCFPQQWPEYGLALKSVYCNSLKMPSIIARDCKLKEKLNRSQIMEAIKGRSFFSIGNTVLAGDMKEVLQELYPLKSKFEI